MLFQIHEDECSEFKSTYDDLQGRSGVTSSRPRVLEVCNLGGIDSEVSTEHLIAVAHTLINPIDHIPVLGAIEGVMSHHLESRQVSPRTANCGHIRQPNAWLRDA